MGGVRRQARHALRPLSRMELVEGRGFPSPRTSFARQAVPSPSAPGAPQGGAGQPAARSRGLGPLADRHASSLPRPPKRLAFSKNALRRREEKSGSGAHGRASQIVIRGAAFAPRRRFLFASVPLRVAGFGHLAAFAPTHGRGSPPGKPSPVPPMCPSGTHRSSVAAGGPLDATSPGDGHVSRRRRRRLLPTQSPS